VDPSARAREAHGARVEQVGGSPRLLCSSHTPRRQGWRVLTAETGGSASAASRCPRPTTARTQAARHPTRGRSGHGLPDTRCGAPTHTQSGLCGAVLAGCRFARLFGVITPRTRSIRVCNRCYRMSEGVMPTGCSPRLSCPLTIAPLCSGGTRGRLPRMGACAPMRCLPRSAARCIYYLI